MKLGIVSQSKLLTVFVRENMTRGLFSHVEGIKVTHGKLWGNLICLFESEAEDVPDRTVLTKLLGDYKIGQLLSLGIGRTSLPLLDNGDVVVGSEARLWQQDRDNGHLTMRAIEAPPKMLDRVLNSLERYSTDEVGSRAIVGTIISGLKEQSHIDSAHKSSAHSVQCWDRDGFYLAEFCDHTHIPWVLVRLVLNEIGQLDKLSPTVKWDMAKKCFWIVKGVLESNNRSTITKRAR